MTQNFVRYSPDVEEIEPGFEQTLQQVLDDMKQHMRGSVKTEGIGLMVRNAHAKGYGLARAEFEILSGMPNEYASRASMPNRDATKPWFVSQTGPITLVAIGSWDRSSASG